MSENDKASTIENTADKMSSDDIDAILAEATQDVENLTQIENNITPIDSSQNKNNDEQPDGGSPLPGDDQSATETKGGEPPDIGAILTESTTTVQNPKTLQDESPASDDAASSPEQSNPTDIDLVADENTRVLDPDDTPFNDSCNTENTPSQDQGNGLDSSKAQPSETTKISSNQIDGPESSEPQSEACDAANSLEESGTPTWKNKVSQLSQAILAFPIMLLEIIDRPFKNVNPRTKSIIGYLGISTLGVAIIIWFASALSISI